MNHNTIRTITDALAGVPRAEWETVKRYIDQAYDAAASRLTLAPEDAETVARRLYYEQGMGDAPTQPANRQERMF